MPIYMDFSAYLGIATAITGVIWAIDHFLFKKARGERKDPKIVEYSRSFFPILLIVFIVRSFFAEPFRIPSGSMKPTLLEGDFILVNKFTYGLRFPLVNKELVKINEPKRGDVIVFRYPNNTKIDFIKRVVGIPGDKIRYEDKTVYVNGEPLKQEFIGTAYDVNGYHMHDPVKHYKETQGIKTHSIYIAPYEGQTMEEKTVPEGMYFVMGDNRDNSEDSRRWGFVPRDLILGKAFFVWLSWDANAKDLRFKRIGRKID